MKERTLVIIKPDAIERKLVCSLVSKFRNEKLDIVEMKFEKVEKSLFEKLYGHIRKKVVNERIFHDTVNFMSSVPLVFLVLEGKNAARRVKELAGATDPVKAKKGTIRGDFGIDSREVADKEFRSVRNLIHASDPESATKEIRYFSENRYRNQQIKKSTIFQINQ